ncbi:hypothetical protein B4589_017935 (plasmid) [Halolamina sp. CBA1230]|uniref:hypothetical protein n=1 Tax=Halolamina sp. CBA1230 TaxID=1853690 RepID=UPI0009A1ADAC|nr:hypothetical protein [Halolamina sp. CBA1230]QKY22276.1 hypothetical protein B4589_017935 [Halolamina sp. CBA1230]
MKSGTGDNPFADEEPEEPPDDQEVDESADEPSFDIGETDSDSSSTSTTSDEYSLPYYQRRGSVKEDRDDVLQFFVREDTAQGEDELERAVANELDIRPKELYKLDLREAALLVAMEHPEEVADKLREWGYEHV